MARPKMRWADLSAGQRAAMVAGGVVQFSLLAYAQWDLTRRPAAEVRGPKWLWRLVTLVNFVGPVAYLVAGRRPSAGPVDAPAAGREVS